MEEEDPINPSYLTGQATPTIDTKLNSSTDVYSLWNSVHLSYYIIA